MTIREKIKEEIRKAIAKIGVPFLDFAIEVPKKEQGELSTNVAFILAKSKKRSPFDVAKELRDILLDSDIFSDIYVAKPGFLNLFLKKEVWSEFFHNICISKDLSIPKPYFGKKAQIEFVSANPTGPLHVGHGRIAAFGDALSLILEALGYRVEREYYLNDAGSQMEILGKSLYLRCKEILGEKVEFPEDFYKGEYLLRIAKDFLKEKGRDFIEREKDISTFSDFAKNKILSWIKDDLSRFGVSFDNFFSERSLIEDGELEKVISELEKEGYLYRRDGAIWFRGKDDKDRVVLRKDGTPTYFATDIAYHKRKIERGFDKLIDVWGADHHGYIPRLKNAIYAISKRDDLLSVILVQMVNLMESGKPISMSTRKGEFVTLRELIEEVGVDAARFIYLTRRAESPLDFDIELAKKSSLENPVYYVQYAHARICSIFDMGTKKGFMFNPSDVNLSLLEEDEFDLLKKVSLFPDVVLLAGTSFEPCKLTTYLLELASLFHAFYNQRRVLVEEKKVANTRLYLIEGTKRVLNFGLKLLGVSAPERM